MISFLRTPDSAAKSKSICRVIQALTDEVLDTGLAIQEICQLVRENSVLVARHRLSGNDQHLSKTRIAVATGLSRAEVAKVLSLKLSSRKWKAKHPIRKLVTAWRFDRRFSSARAEPKTLPIYGKRSSFENLVTVSNRGTPVRAMLDELVHIKVAKVLPGQRVQLMAPLPAFGELTLIRELMGASRYKTKRTNGLRTSIRLARKNLKKSPSARYK
jgi:Family of unknown function (DUF6502)